MPTVKFHITNILGKLVVDNRTEAVIKALKHRLVPPP
jgi:NarL family two-component system response regulator LiaR